MRNIFKVPNEKGAVIVFFAITLPLFLMLVGGAIDFGNAYIHKSRLQNTADAAVLAGAREFAVHGENDSIHPYADDEAARYVEHNAETANGSLPSTIKGKRYQAKQVDNVIYYRVLLTEEVPFYFLRILGDNFKSLDIQADAVAAISATSGSGEDVFIFSRDFSLVNTISNPDNFDEDGQILTCFDASVAFTDRNNPYNEKHHYNFLGYSDQALGQPYDANKRLGSFFTSKAKGMSVNAARAQDGVTQEMLDEIWEAQSQGSKTEGIRYDKEKYVHTASYISYDMDDILRQTTGQLNIGLHLPTKPEEMPYPPNEWQYKDWRYWQVMNDEEKKAVDAEYQKAYDEYTEKKAAYDAAIAAYEAEMSKYNTTTRTFHASDLRNGNVAMAPGKTDQGENFNRTIELDGSLGNKDDSPIYVYIDESFKPVHINVTANNDRPIVLCYAGRGQLDFNLSEGVTFRGILYVPNSGETGNAMDVIIHDSKGSRFEGSIISQSLALHGSQSTYEYKDFGVTGSGYVGGGTGSGRVSASSSVKLVPSSQIDWD